MKIDKLYIATKNKLFTDLVLTLDDGVNILTIDVHKNVLYASCDYFEKMLSKDSFKEANSSIIKMIVPDAFVFYDIIMDFYGQKIKSGKYAEWYYILKSYLCHDFIGLYYDIKLIVNLIVPSDDFDTLLEIAEMIGHNVYTLTLIKKNFPIDYPLENLSNELVEKILNIDNLKIIVQQKNSINIFNADTGELDKSFENDYEIEWLLVLDNNKLILAGDDSHIKILDIPSGSIIKEKDNGSNISMIFVTKNSIITYDKDHYLKIWDKELDGSKQIFNDEYDFEFFSWIETISSDGKKIISNNTAHEIKISDLETNNLIATIDNKYFVLDMFFLPGDLEVLIFDSDMRHLTPIHRHRAKIYDAKTGQLLRTIFDCENDYCNSIELSPDNSILISYGNKRNDNISIVELWDISTGKLINTFKYDNRIINATILDDNITLVTSCVKGLKIWNIETNKLLKEIDTKINIRHKLFLNNCNSDLNKKLEKYLENKGKKFIQSFYFNK